MDDYDIEKIIPDVDLSVAGISQKTVRKIISAWQKSGNAPPKIRKDIPEADRGLLLNQIADCIKDEGGEISRLAKVVHLAIIYIGLSDKGKGVFLRCLARNFDVDIKALDEKILSLKAAENDTKKIAAEIDLRDALIPPRVKFLRQLITLPNGFIFLKDMRRDLLPFIKSIPRLKKLDDDIKSLLTSYFDVNLFDLIEINWNSPASMLERLMKYEAVHEIKSWNELKHRLFTDHRVFAFFHSKMPNDPLIFVEVALVNGMANNIQKLIDVNEKPLDPNKADTAIFYSISATQKGLRGISFGNFLIRQVVERLSSEFSNLTTFATLSPVPLFIKWLDTYISNGNDNLIKEAEAKVICKLSGVNNVNMALKSLLSKKNWHESTEISDAIKKPLMRLAAHFILKVKRGSGNSAYDPVANFHLSNGAKLEHIHWLADISAKGIKESAGIMVNYHYRLDKIVINHENYMTDGIIHASSDAKSWLR